MADLSVFPAAPDDGIVVNRSEMMIEGLKLTMTGAQLRARLDERVQRHEQLAEHYKREAKRQPDPNADEYDFVLPEQVCEYEQELHEWRAEALAYVRDHVETGEVYRLGKDDLEFGELLPEKPESVEQEDYEREERIGLGMERIAKEIRRSRFDMGALAQVVSAREESAKGG